jgi:MoaA/NifB/PqqE/SkfB family radical SAM enzyme
MATFTATASGLMAIAPGIWSFVRGRPFAFSINVSNMCPLGCECYWRIGGEAAKGKEIQMTEDQMVTFFHEMRSRGFVGVYMIGGEPYTRPGLLERLDGILPVGHVVTSGTTPLRHLRHTVHHISIDGADAETHNAVRRSSGLYERIIRNLTRARESFSPFPAHIHVVLNSINYRQIGEILAVWSENGLADKMWVSTLTPIGEADRELRLTTQQRNWIVDTLHSLKKQYKGFLGNSEAILDILRPDYTQHLTPESCNLARFVWSLDASGQRIDQCVFGPQADCSQCGCVAMAYTQRLASPGGIVAAWNIVP